MNAFSQSGGRAYQGALEAVLAILVGGGLGYWVDFETGKSPLFLLVGLVLGFCAFVLRMVRLARSLRTLENEKTVNSEHFRGGAWEDDDW